MKTKLVTINARKYDGQIHRSWKAELVEQKDSLLVFVGEFEQEVKHRDLGIIRRGTLSYEYYWLGRWYNVFRFHEPNGDFRNYYCNINMPPEFQEDVLDYVDLDIDILLWKNGKPIILDEDEYSLNSKKFQYPAIIDTNARSSLKELSSLIKKRKFPFDKDY